MRRLILFLVFIFIHFVAFSQMAITPESYEFDAQQIGYSSNEAIFQLENQGEEPVTIQPENITLTGQDAQSVNLSILTYNIWHDNQNWPERMERMLKDIEQFDPDIIGLQEVIERPNLENQAKTLADSLGFHYYFCSVDPVGSDTRFGNAILSRYPIADSSFRKLEPLDDYRVAGHVKVNVEGNVIDVYVTHLHNQAVNHDIREQQITDLLDFIEDTHSGGYTFVMGDYNADPDWEEMELMYENYHDVYPLFYENPNSPKHSTLNYNLGHAQRRIDYIFYKKANHTMLKPLSADIVIDTANQDGVYGSDHFGVLAEFKLLSDTEQFTLNNISEETELAGGESTSVGVLFEPFTAGTKEIYLNANDAQSAITGKAFDATVTEYPWSQSFDTLDESEIPFGWEKNAENWGATSTSHAGGTSPEITFSSDPANSGTLYLKTPPFNTNGLDSMMFYFHHRISNEGASGNYTLKVVSMYNDEESIIQQWENPGDVSPKKFSIKMKEEHGLGNESLRIAWIFEGNSENISQWNIDEITLEALPALAVSPDEYDFENQEINTASEEHTFTLTNIGGGTLNIAPSEISIEGSDSKAFQLNNLSDPVALGNDETAEIGITFHPESEGEKEASLVIGETTVALQGNAFDPTIYELPWTEDFSDLTGGDIPLGWTKDSDNWQSFNSNNAGGEAPELVFWWQPEIEGEFYLTTPEIITQSMDTVVLTFKHRIRNYGQPGDYTLKVKSITGDNEYLIHEWVDPATIEATEITMVLDSENHGVGSESFRLAWVFDGQTNNITQWDIDDIHLYQPSDTVIAQITPESHDFGNVPVESSSEAQTFTIKNIGGQKWNLHPDDIEITGTNADDFKLDNLEEETVLGLNESAEINVTFEPSTVGKKEAMLYIDGNEISLSGDALSDEGYFIYCDFSIVKDGTPYTNVGGFREVPDSSQNGSLEATDLSGQGKYGNTVLQLDYDLSLAEEFTVYYMWAYPMVDLSGYTHIVLRVKADEAITDLKLKMQDTEGVEGEDGGSYNYIDVNPEWHKIVMAVEDFELESWAQNLPDMSKIQKIDLLFEKGTTEPSQGTLYVDLVGFSTGDLTDLGNVNTSETGLEVYPNPADEYVNIKMAQEGHLSIMDITGKTIRRLHKTAGISKLSVSDLEKGIYIIKADYEQYTGVEKIIVH